MCFLLLFKEKDSEWNIYWKKLDQSQVRKRNEMSSLLKSLATPRFFSLTPNSVLMSQTYICAVVRFLPKLFIFCEEYTFTFKLYNIL
jgi:hypothetical protein